MYWHNGAFMASIVSLEVDIVHRKRMGYGNTNVWYGYGDMPEPQFNPSQV